MEQINSLIRGRSVVQEIRGKLGSMQRRAGLTDCNKATMMAMKQGCYKECFALVMLIGCWVKIANKHSLVKEMLYRASKPVN